MHFGGQEYLIIILIIVLLFGARKIPELGKSLGLGIKEFKKSAKAITEDDEKQQKSQED
jgi:sec-independent protein translocase protein TatA